MTRRKAREVRTTLTVWGLTSLAAILLQPSHGFDDMVAATLICLVIALTMGLVYRRLLPRLRGLPMLAAVALTGLAFLAVVVFAFTILIWTLFAIQSGQPFALKTARGVIETFTQKGAGTGVMYAYGLVLSTTFTLELSRRLGSQRVLSLLLGRYRDPKEERRVFLLIDLRDSTPLAERLGSVRFSGLLRDLFRDITDPIVDTGGEVVGYVGDEAIVSWSERRGIEDANAVRCFQMLRARLIARASVYEGCYGAAPRIKGAIHLGPVVVTEVGELRTDVAFHGDALNTATRILDECGPLEADLLLSGPTADLLPPTPGIVLEPLGHFPLRGKGEPLALVRAAFKD